MQPRSLAVSFTFAALVIAAACSTKQPSPEVQQASRDAAATPHEARAESDLLMKDEAESARGSGLGAVASSGAESGRADMAAQPSSQPAMIGHGVAPPTMTNQAGHKRVRELAIGPPCCAQSGVQNTENYAHVDASPVQRVAEAPVSTFSIDVDTGSYSNLRRMLNQGQLPPQDAVRVEEMINYFDYAYAPPRDRSVPFAVSTEIAPTPWNAKTKLLQIGIKGWQPQGARVPSNLVFLVDVSGSMQEENKLPLVKSSLRLLTRHLTREDRVSLVVYAGASGLVLPPTPGDRAGVILGALDRLEAGGSTNGADGIQLAYRMAEQAYMKNGNNRVLLATDGDFNVGIVDFDHLVDLVEDKRKSGIALTTLGFGGGNYNDHLMEQLADAGNGNHAYIDTLAEAQKVLVDQRDATLTTIARDVKIQVEFNPAVVTEYRLIGYENRVLKREDFNNDQVDAGEIGAGHTVTALYEIALAGQGGARVDPLRYGTEQPVVLADTSEFAFLRLRYKNPGEGMAAKSRLIERPIRSDSLRASLDGASRNLRLAAAVAAFGQLLRGDGHTGEFQYTDVERLARASRGEDPDGYTGEFLQLVKLAGSLATKQARADAEIHLEE